MQQYPRPVKYIYEATPDSVAVPLDTFQSTALLSVHYNRIDAELPYASVPSVFEFEGLLETTSPVVTRSLLAAKLVQVTPIRALLAVAGESWILSEKVPTAQAFAALKTTLRTWTAQLWSTTDGLHTTQCAPVKQALRLSVEILEQALEDQRDSLTPEMGSDMGIYFAALVLWAITTTATTRVKGPQSNSQSPVSRLSSTSSTASLSGQFLHHASLSLPSTQPAAAEFNPLPSSPLAAPQQNNPCLLSHAQITINAISFLSSAVFDFTNATSLAQLGLDIARYQAGCTSLLLWVKLRLRGVALGDGVGRTGDLG